MRKLMILAALTPTLVFAQVQTDPSQYATSVYREVAQPTTTTTAPAGGGNSINPAAQQGKNSQSSGSGANMAAGAAMLAACMMTMPPNIALCAMGAMAMMQGGHDKDAAQQSGATYQASSNSGATGTNTSPTTYADPSKGTGKYSDQVKAGLQSLDDAGVKVSESGVTMPDGTKVSAGNMGNASAMTAAGFDAKAVADAKKVTDALNAEIANGRVSNVALAEGGGGGYAGASENANGSNENGATIPPGFDPFGTGAGGAAAARARALAGKTVNFDGEPIGVRGNNIFEMVHNCYQRKRAGNHFIENEAAAVRAPASSASASSIRPTAIRKK